MSRFLDAVELLRRNGHRVEFGVYGEGNPGSSRARLEAMDGTVVNRWIRTEEVAPVFARYHAIVASHTEASQSGVVAAALGAGLPVVATPVGGLAEQVADGVTGTVAASSAAADIAAAILRLMLNPQLYAAVCHNIALTSPARSMRRFIEMSVASALDGPQPEP